MHSEFRPRRSRALSSPSDELALLKARLRDGGHAAPFALFAPEAMQSLQPLESLDGIDDHNRWTRVRQLHRRLEEKLRRRRAARNAIDDQPVGRLAADRRSVEHRREHGHQFGKHDLVDDLQRKRVTLALVLDACPFRLCPGVCPELVEGRECHELWQRESRQSSDHTQKESANAL